MDIGETLYVTDRKDWRSWLAKNHDSKSEIWLVYYRKASGKPRIPYNDAVEEALCYGWIDSIMKRIDDESFAQRFSPRRSNSVFSGANKERVRRLIAQGQMTPAGLDAIAHVYDPDMDTKELVIADDILDALHKDEDTWENFQGFPESYKRVRIGWIEEARSRPDVFDTRLRYFLKMTKKNKRYGMVQ